MSGLWGMALLLAGLSACGSSSTKCTSNCTADATTGDDARGGAGGSGGGSGAGGAEPRDAHDDGARDASAPVDGAVACEQSIAAACAVTPDAGSFAVHCAATWAATTTNAYLCSRPQTTVLVETCGTDKELIVTNPSGGSDEYIYVYDSSGALYAISYAMAGTSHCVAGTKAFVDPVGCTPPTPFSCPKDGGAKI